MQKIKIIKCNDGHKWYSSLVGQTVPLVSVESNEYMSKEPAGYINFVAKDDAVLVDVAYKTCTKFRVKKAETAFSMESGRGYRKTSCRLCVRSVSKVRDALHKEMGTPPDDYECPICLRNEEEAAGCGGVNKSPWALDHDHLTSKFRGWLCHSCNRTLGGLKDDFGALNRIRTYLKKGRE